MKICLGRIRIRNLGFFLRVLTILSFFWAVGFRVFLFSRPSFSILGSLNIMLIIFLLTFFCANKTFRIYISFELAVVPIFIIILGWGYQVERLPARISLLFYTLSASLPFLLLLLTIRRNLRLFTLSNLTNFSRINEASRKWIISLLFLLAFAVKLPMFGVHVWLPKAHVEAPVLGSITLAAILLKLGRYGLWLFIPVCWSWNTLLIWLSISLIGRFFIRLLCLRLTDLKIIIAFSSVSHMGIVLAALSAASNLGMLGGFALIVAHGATSSAMFLIAQLLYQTNNSRRILLIKGVLGWAYRVPLLWFLVLISNIAAPPTFNLPAELLVIISLVLDRRNNLLALAIIILAGTAYSLVIFSATSQGTGPSPITRNPTLVANLIRIVNHIFWRFFLILALNILRRS